MAKFSQALFFYIALPFIFLLSILPFRALYFLSDGIYFLIYYVLRYRREIVMQNLKKSFPGKSLDELKVIHKKFYKYFCDLFLETFKTLTISRTSMLSHCSMSAKGKFLFDELAKEKRSVIIVMGHYGNWEWAGNTFSIECKQQLYVIYHPLSNKYFNGLIYRMRTRFGTKLISMKDTFREMVLKRDEVNATAFIADQTPPPNGAYWTKFLNQDTPVFKGTEKIAQKMGYPVIYVSVKRLKRGYYEMDAEILTDHPAGTTDGEISELHTRRLEKDIMSDPVIWLWSHRRWKHKRS